MSLILDALRKMEEDRKSRRGAQDIRPEVLRYRADVKPREARPYLPVTIGLVLLAAGIGAGIFLKGGGGSASRGDAGAPQVSSAGLSQPAPAPAPAAAGQTPVLPAVAPVTLPAPAAPQAPPPAGSTGQPAATPAFAAAGRSQPQPTAAQPEAPATPQARAARRAPAVELQAAPADITISGIAWQDERTLRRAVLNGTLVGEGAEVAGARVVEIRENKVRLSRDGQLFEVIFTSGAQAR